MTHGRTFILFSSTPSWSGMMTSQSIFWGAADIAICLVDIPTTGPFAFERMTAVMRDVTRRAIWVKRTRRGESLLYVF
jgi:hypothetical protein